MTDPVPFYVPFNWTELSFEQADLLLNALVDIGSDADREKVNRYLLELEVLQGADDEFIVRFPNGRPYNFMTDDLWQFVSHVLNLE